MITKDEILQQLNLGNNENGIGNGKYGTNSKQALTNDIVEGIQKELEKLRRTEENIKLRQKNTKNG